MYSKTGDDIVKICILDDEKICDNCNDCQMCDLEPSKVCDNCGKCIEVTEDNMTINIDKIYMFEDEYKE